MKTEPNAWKANMDIQTVFTHYNTVTYMCAYFSKAEDEASELMKQAAKKVSASGKSNFEKMRAVVRHTLPNVSAPCKK